MRIMDGYQTEKYVESLMSTEKTSSQNLTGWICPVCGRGLSPFTAMCPCKGLKDLPSVQPEPHWIPCSERLPDAECGESDIVLATCGYMNVKDTSVRWIKTLYFNGGNWCYPTGETYEQKVYAWMPLPEPYREDDDDHT